jgi:RNA polymerase sigma-70 factor (ECF subfamily)
MQSSSPDNPNPPGPAEIKRLVEASVTGDVASLERLLHAHTGRLMRMISLRLDARMSRRVDAEDVLQEVQLRASRHLSDYLRTPEVPFYLWLRGVAANVLLEVHRRHLGTRMRDARREVPLSRRRGPEPSSQVLAWDLADSSTSPSNAAMKAEFKQRIETVVDSMPAADKEVLALRHFEQLSPTETAHILEISEKAAGMRYLRALKRLRDQLGDLSGWRL